MKRYIVVCYDHCTGGEEVVLCDTFQNAKEKALASGTVDGKVLEISKAWMVKDGELVMVLPAPPWPHVKAQPASQSPP